MPKPVSRRELIRRMQVLGWDGPIPGTRHAAMEKGAYLVRIPNPHGSDYDWTLVKRILKQAGITQEEWDKAGEE